jgi:hypothetical protein
VACQAGAGFGRSVRPLSRQKTPGGQEAHGHFQPALTTQLRPPRLLSLEVRVDQRGHHLTNGPIRPLVIINGANPNNGK